MIIIMMMMMMMMIIIIIIIIIIINKKNNNNKKKPAQARSESQTHCFYHLFLVHFMVLHQLHVTWQ